MVFEDHAELLWLRGRSCAGEVARDRRLLISVDEEARARPIVRMTTEGYAWRRHCDGVTCILRKNSLPKCDESLKPHANAMSVIER